MDFNGLLRYPSPLLICTGFLKYPFGHLFQTEMEMDFKTKGTFIKDVRFFCNFWRYLPTYVLYTIYYLLMYYVRFYLTYLPTQKSDILYGQPLWVNSKLALILLDSQKLFFMRFSLSYSFKLDSYDGNSRRTSKWCALNKVFSINLCGLSSHYVLDVFDFIFNWYIRPRNSTIFS